MPKPLVIVESPAKATTLRRFLGDRFEVLASVGHVRDLPESADEVPDEIKKEPWGRLGVDVERDFKAYYVVPADKRRQIAKLRAAMKDASELVLATDPDREGESISWHLREVLKPRKGLPVRRIVFHEITEEAVQEALNAPSHDVDENLVRAQESRRILDRLFGYTVSPVLWKKVQTGLSAGRVQSVAVRLVVEREEERLGFRSSRYWDLDARIARGDRAFTATLVRVDGARLATGKDFDASTGVVQSRGVRLLDEAGARVLVDGFEAGLPWRVAAVDEKPVTQRPAPPFTTSTLQQEANRKLGFSSERTMQVAQRLFQGVEIGGGMMEGLISYHRTDSTTLSDKALRESARVIREMFGAEYHTGPRQYQTRVRNAQEAHEAIRPTDFRLAPQQLAGVLDRDELRLYELVWKRTIASQMAEARLLRTTVELAARAPGGAEGIFTSSGKTIEFPGFLRAYVEGSDDPAAELGDQETLLPSCAVGDLVDRTARPDGLVLSQLEAKGHETVPPARYTEASLVKRLEEDGIGRPSTYAPTMATIQRRGYVFRQGKALVPSFVAFAVTRLLREHFGDYVDPGFTARMEDILDDISNGKKDWLDFLREFYHGGGDEGPGLENKVKASDDAIEYPSIDVGADPESGAPIRVRIGRYGPFLQRGEGGDGHTASLPDDLAPADLTVDRAVALLAARAAGPRVVGTDPKTGLAVYVMTGRFGPYVQLGETPEHPKRGEKPRRASLVGDLTEENVTLDAALRLLALPRVLGPHPDDGGEVSANFGRFGPYVRHGSEFRSLDADEQVFTITLEDAVARLREPKRSRRRQAAAKTVLRDLGTEVASGAAVTILDGRYGPYVTDGTTNASLPKGTSVEAVTLGEALALLHERAASGRKKPARREAAGGRRAAAPRSKASTRARTRKQG
jgi:DNA topoisomerase I